MKPGSLFTIEIEGDLKCLCHVVSTEPDAMGGVVCALSFKAYDTQDQRNKLDISDVLSVQFVTPDSFDLPKWEWVGSQDLTYLETHVFALGLPDKRRGGFIGTKILGGAIIEGFLKASFGLEPWDAWADPQYLDSLLAPGVARPPMARLKSEFGVKH